MLCRRLSWQPWRCFRSCRYSRRARRPGPCGCLPGPCRPVGPSLPSLQPWRPRPLRLFLPSPPPAAACSGRSAADSAVTNDALVVSTALKACCTVLIFSSCRWNSCVVPVISVMPRLAACMAVSTRCWPPRWSVLPGDVVLIECSSGESAPLRRSRDRPSALPRWPAHSCCICSKAARSMMRMAAITRHAGRRRALRAPAPGRPRCNPARSGHLRRRATVATREKFDGKHALRPQLDLRWWKVLCLQSKLHQLGLGGARQYRAPTASISFCVRPAGPVATDDGAIQAGLLLQRQLDAAVSSATSASQSTTMSRMAWATLNVSSPRRSSRLGSRLPTGAGRSG